MIWDRNTTVFALVLGAALLAGCAGTSKAPPARLAADASAALSEGRVMRAVRLAEHALEADPRNGEVRALLGNAYLQAGRFASARQAFVEAAELGQSGGKLALGKALSELALGRNAEALQTLIDNRETIPAADLGLGLALAGETNKGILILADRLRKGENSEKLRQNLAFAYALDGRWLQAKVMAAQDVPAARLDARMAEWAAIVRPDASQRRLASLLKVPVVARDGGMPAALALQNAPSVEQLAREAVAPTAASATPVADLQTQVPDRHIVQLGSFASPQGARHALREYRRTMPELQAYRTVTTRVEVDGKPYWRLQATGFSGEQAASATCGRIRTAGGDCLVMSEASHPATARRSPTGAYGLDWRRLR